jgi:hypothetical protein
MKLQIADCRLQIGFRFQIGIARRPRPDRRGALDSDLKPERRSLTTARATLGIDRGNPQSGFRNLQSAICNLQFLVVPT